MAGPIRREERELTGIRVVMDPAADGRVICVGGGAPGLVRVTGFDGLTCYTFAAVPFDGTDPRATLWPVITPPDFVKYPAVRFYLASDLRPVDLLSIFSGHLRTAKRGFYVWQAAVDPPLSELTERDLRLALRSTWVDGVQRGDVAGVRGIIVRK